MKYQKEIIRIALPAMVENVLQMLMGVVDNYLVVHVSLVAVSGISVANNIITVYQVIFIALGAGVSSVVAKSRGRRDVKRTISYQGQALSFTLLFSLILGVVSLFASRTTLLLLGAEATVAGAGGIYLSIVGGGIVSLALMTILGAFLRAQERPEFPMYVSLFVNALNVVLATLSIFVFSFGVAGVAVSTLLSRLVGVFLLATQLPIGNIVKNMSFKNSRELLSVALPSAGERLMMRAGDVVIIAIVVKFGMEIVGGNAIGEVLTQFNYMPGMSMSTAVVVLVAHRLGKQKEDEVNGIIRESFIMSTGLMILVGSLVFVFGDFLTSLFTTDSLAIKGSLIVVFYSFIGSPATSGTLVYTAAWQGIGNAKLPFYATTFGMWGIRIILGYVLGITLQVGLAGVWLATLSDNVFRWGFLYYTYKKHAVAKFR